MASYRFLRTAALSLVLCPSILCTGLVTLAKENLPNTTTQRPRTGLVLSGGGARGAAHIGVLKVLEEAKIPIDFIVGTSMGSIVGGLYAAGLSPEEMERAVAETDWDAVFDDRPDRRLIPFRRKKDDFKDLAQFDFAVNRNGLSVGSGMIGGRKLEFLLRSLLFNTTHRQDFDDLGIPFRAVATELASGEMVVLGEGDLADALRASMSVPGVFLPVEIDGQRLVDGGLVRNIPVDVAKALGAERLIVIDISSPLGNLPERQSSFGVLMRSFAVTMMQNKTESISQLSGDDLLLTPDLEHYSAADFGHTRQIIALGEQAARDQLSVLKRFAVDDQEFEQFLSRQRGGEDRDRQAPLINRISVEGLRRVDKRLVLGHMRSQVNRPLDLSQLQRDLGRVYEIGEFRSVDFNLRDDQGQTQLIISVKEEEQAGFLRFGLTLESDFQGAGDFIFRGDYRWTQVNRLGAEWQTTLFAGKENGFESEFYQPLDYSGGWFVAPNARFLRTTINGQVGIDVRSRTVGVDFGYQFGNWAELRLGAFSGKLDATAHSLLGDADFDFDLGAYRVTFQLDQLDSAFVPRDGFFLYAEYDEYNDTLGSDHNYKRLSVALARAWSLRDFTVLMKADYGDDRGTSLPLYNGFALGGFLELSGLAPGELTGDTLGLAQMMVYQRVATFPGRLGSGVFAGASLEFGNVWNDPETASFSDLKTAGSLFLAVDSILGPAWLAIASSGGNSAIYFLLGHPF